MKWANGCSARRATLHETPTSLAGSDARTSAELHHRVIPAKCPARIAPRAGDGMLSHAGPIAFPIELLRGAASPLRAVKIAAVTAAAGPGFVAGAALAPWLYGGLVLAWAL